MLHFSRSFDDEPLDGIIFEEASANVFLVRTCSVLSNNFPILKVIIDFDS